MFFFVKGEMQIGKPRTPLETTSNSPDTSLNTTDTPIQSRKSVFNRVISIVTRKVLRFCHTLNEPKLYSKSLETSSPKKGGTENYVYGDWTEMKKFLWCWQRMSSRQTRNRCHLQSRGLPLLNVVTLCSSIIHLWTADSNVWSHNGDEGEEGMMKRRDTT